ncbi:MAG TPA: Gfo/Idh/MocA family oxidoreductase [Candidatus Pelethocola excrementipullorum]|nr:Gfo/Idh/MocA family oxidoreductase [Candidatus Pelethocola excrementipullorum]
MKIGIIGFGGMANWHRETIAEIEGLEVAGIYDVKEERREFAKECNLHVYNSIEELLGDPGIDLVLVATPNDLHKPIAIQAMRAGKPVVSEKPVTLSSSDLQEMMDVSEETGVYLTVHQNRRWDEDFLTIQKILDENKLGEVFRIESRVHGSRGIPGDWRQEKEHGGGMVLDWGVHLLDQILMMMKDVKLKRVFASVTNVTNQLVDDGFTAILTFENKVEVLVEVGTSNFISLPRWYVLGQDGTAIIKDWDLSGEIVCAAGVNEKDVVPVRTAAGLTKTMAPRREDTIHRYELPIVKSDIRDFYRNVMAVIEKKEESKIQLPEVMRVMKLMEAIFESARFNQVLDFE